MRTSSAASLILGAALLVAGFGMMSDGSPTRGFLAQSLSSWFDMKERQCRQASVAVGAACPLGCVARPLGTSSARSTPPECHSRLWVDTCGKACAPKKGFARLQDGSLIDAARLIVTFRREPDAALERELTALGVTLSPRFDGLDRYDAVVKGENLQKIKKRLTTLPQISSAEYVLR